MKRHVLAVGTAVMMAAVAAIAAEPIDENDMGLIEMNVFEAPTPQPFAYGDKFPGEAQNLPTAYPGAPPQIPHDISAFEPVTIKKNLCLRCHDKPELQGKQAEGEATPMPPSHYRDVRTPDTATQRVDGSRFLCLQCHVPQAQVAPLVKNTFGSGTE